MTDEELKKKKRELYIGMIETSLKKERLDQKDLVMLLSGYKKLKAIVDENYMRLVDKKVLLYTKKYPESATLIGNLLGLNNSTELTNNLLTQDVDSLVINLNSVLNSPSIDEQLIRQYYDQIKFKMHELSNNRNNISTEDYNMAMSKLHDARIRCEETLSLIQEENNAWGL